MTASLMVVSELTRQISIFFVASFLRSFLMVIQRARERARQSGRGMKGGGDQ